MTPAAPAPFGALIRVRYHECDAQGIVFNARWGEYVDVAATEYTRVLFGGVTAEAAGIDWRLVRQTLDWRAPARFDDVLLARVHTVKVGTTSFTLATEFSRWPDGAVLVSAETIYVVVDPASGTKRAVPARHRAALEAGAPGVRVDCAAAGVR